MGLLRSRFGLLYVFGAVFLAVATLTRVALAAWSFPDISHNPLTLLAMLAVGIFFDFVTFSYFALLPALYLLFVPDRLFRWRFNRWLLLGIYFLIVCVLLFNACAEWLFWDEFQTRYNFVAVDYLIYTTEVLGNIGQSYPVWPLIAGIVVGATLVFLLTRRALAQAFEERERFRR
ncbi:MAG: hypothetical protein NTZ61_00030, partial [Proteobacteria bacterium]|nr:hypothetical protein [Pseudomonadota bacterium]